MPSSGTTTRYCFIYDGSSASAFTYGGTYTQGNAINNHDVIAGATNLGGDSRDYGFTDDGTPVSLVALGGVVTAITAINDSGALAGVYTPLGGTTTRAFLCNSTLTTDLGTLGGAGSEALGINAGGQVVGDSNAADGSLHAFLYKNGAMVDLNSLINPASGWTLDTAAAINDSGAIVGTGTDAADETGAFLLTPAMPGDANLDGAVNGTDLNIVLSNYNQTGMDWYHGDFNGDGAVDGADLNIVLSNYNQTASVSAVPEPSALAMLALVAIGMLAWNRRGRRQS